MASSENKPIVVAPLCFDPRPREGATSACSLVHGTRKQAVSIRAPVRGRPPLPGHTGTEVLNLCFDPRPREGATIIGASCTKTTLAATFRSAPP